MWSNKYIGIPFKEGGRDFDGIDCWGLTRLVYNNEYNIKLPSFNNEYIISDSDRIAELFSRYKEGWTPVTEPEEGSLVTFNILGNQTHVGVITDKTSFLHIRENQTSTVEKLNSIIWNKRIAGFYKYNPYSSAQLTLAPHPLKTDKYILPIIPGTTVEEVSEYVIENWKVNKELKSNLNIIVNGNIIEKHNWKNLVLTSNDLIEVRSVARGGGGGLRLFLLVALAIAAPYLAGALQAFGAGMMAGTGFAGALSGAAMTLGAGITATGLTGALLTAGISLVGGALINAIAPIRAPSTDVKDPGSAEQQMILSGAANKVNPYEAIPIILGKLRVTPPLAAQNYTTFQNERDSYLTMLLCWGYGPLEISKTGGVYNYKIGNQPLSQFTQVTKQQTLERKFVTGGALDNTVSEKTTLNDIYPGDINQRWEQKTLEWNADGYSAAGQPSPYATPLWVFPGVPTVGLASNPNIISYTFPAKVTGQNDYTKIHVVLHFPQGLRAIKVKGNDGIGDQFALANSATSDNGASGLLARLQRDLLVYRELEGDPSVPPPITYNVNAPHHPVIIKVQWSSDGLNWTDMFGPFLEYGGSSPKKDAFTVTVEKIIPQGDPFRRSAIHIRAWRANWSGTDPVKADGTTTDYRYYHAVQLLNFTAFTQQEPYYDPPNSKLALTALELKSDKVMNGQVEGINAVVQTYAFNYTGTPGVWTAGVIDNPAALYIYIMTHPANPRRLCNLMDGSGNFNVTEIQKYIDLAKLEEWYQYCNGTLSNANMVMTTGAAPSGDLAYTPMVSVQYKKNGVNVGSPVLRPKFKFNSVVATQRSILEVLRDVCAAGRGSPTIIDGRWTVTYDNYTSTVVQHFTPHNTWGFESTRVLTELPHALRIEYNDERDSYDYKTAESIVYNAGYAQIATGIKKAATLFESIPLPGITNSLLVYDHAKWHMAQAILRRELYTINADLEYLVCNRGDRVRVTHDVPMWGIHSARVKTRMPTNGMGATTPSADTIGIDLTEEFQIDPAKSYHVKIRSGNNKGIESERSIKTTGFAINKIIRQNNIVTAYFTNPYHPLKRGNLFVLTGTGLANCDSAGLDEVLYEDTDASTEGAFFRFKNIGPDGAWTVSANLDLANNWYSKVIFTSAILGTAGVPNCDDDDLVMFGYANMVSNDLLVIGVEPTGKQTARLTLVDYAENIYWDYPSLTGTDLFATNITPGRRIDSGWEIQEVPYVTSVISDDSVADLIAEGIYKYKIRITFSLFGPNTKTLSPGITHVQCQYGLDKRSTTITAVPWLSNNLIGNDYPTTAVAGDPTESNLNLISVPITQNYIDIPDVKPGEVWKFRLRFAADTGATGLWTPLAVNGISYWYQHKVQGKDKNYNQVSEVRIRRIGKYLEINPIMSPLPADFSHFEIRIYKNDGFSAIKGNTINSLYDGKDAQYFNGARLSHTDTNDLDFWPAEDLLPIATGTTTPNPETGKIHRYIGGSIFAGTDKIKYIDNPWVKVIETKGLTQFDLTNFDSDLVGALITIPGIKYRVVCRAVDSLGNYSRKINPTVANQKSTPVVSEGTAGDVGNLDQGVVTRTTDGFEFATATNSIILKSISPPENTLTLNARGFELEVKSPTDTETTKLLQQNGLFALNTLTVPRDDYKKLKIWISDYPNPVIYYTTTTQNVYREASSDPRYNYGVQANQLKLPGDLGGLPPTHCATKTATFTAQTDTPGTASKNIVVTGVVGDIQLGAILVNVSVDSLSSRGSSAPYGQILNRPGIWISIISQTSGTSGKDGTYVISEFQNIPVGTPLKTVPNIIYDSEDLSPSVTGLYPERQYYIRYALFSELAPDPSPPDYILNPTTLITKNEDIWFSSQISVVPDNSIEEVDTAFPPDVGTDGQVITVTTSLNSIIITLSQNPQYGIGLSQQTATNNLPNYYGAYGTGIDDDGKFAIGKEYVVVSVGTGTDWHEIAGTTPQTHPAYVIGSSFVAKEIGSGTVLGTGKAQRLDTISSSHAATLVFMGKQRFPTSQYGEILWPDVANRIVARIPNNQLVYSIPAEPGSYYKLWFKYESRAGVQSRNPYGPLIAQTGQDAGKWLSILTQQISQGQLYKTFNTRIDAVDRGDKPIATQVEQLDNQFSVKVDNSGHVSGFGLSSTGNGANNAISEFGVRASRFWIAAPSVISPTQPPVSSWFPGKVWVDTSAVDPDKGGLVTGVTFYYNTWRPDVHNKTIYPNVSAFQYWEQVDQEWINTRATFQWQGRYNYQTLYELGDLVFWADADTDKTYKYIGTTPSSGATWKYVAGTGPDLAGHRPGVNTALWQLVTHTTPIVSTANNTTAAVKSYAETPTVPTLGSDSFSTTSTQQTLSGVISTSTDKLASGPFTLKWQDIWQPDKDYAVDDIVRIGIDTFVCKIPYDTVILENVETILNDSNISANDKGNDHLDPGLNGQDYVNLANPTYTPPTGPPEPQQKILNAGLFKTTSAVTIATDKTVYAVGTDTKNYMGNTFSSRGIMYYVIDVPSSGKFQLSTRKDGEPINTSVAGIVKYCVVKLDGAGKPVKDQDDLNLDPANDLAWETDIKRVRFPFVVVTEPQTAEQNNGEPIPLGVYIDAAYIRNATITNAKIAHAAITNAKISDLNAEKITAGLISADRIGAGTITANKINATNLAAIRATLGTVTTGKIQSADNLMVIDFDNKYIRIDSGGA